MSLEIKKTAVIELPIEVQEMIKQILKDRDEAVSRVVWGFYEEEKPLFSQGLSGGCELSSPVTAEECKGYVDWIEELKKENEVLKKENEVLKKELYLSRMTMVLENLKDYGNTAPPRSPKMMPIIRSAIEQARKAGIEIDDMVVAIPWSLIEDHDYQANLNHYQSLEEMRLRGGLSQCEALAIIEDRSYTKMPISEANSRLMKMIVDHEQESHASKENM